MRTSRRNGGVFDFDDVIDAGIGRAAFYRLVDEGIITRLHLGVYSLAGMPDSWERRALAAQRRGGDRCLLAFASAGRMHDLHDLQQVHDIELVFPRDGLVQVPDAVLHTTTRLDPADRTRVGRFRVTGLDRTLHDLAGRFGLHWTKHALLTEWRRGRTDPVTFGAQITRRGPAPGTSVARSAALAMDSELLRVRSPKEADAYWAVVDAGLPAPRINWRTVDGEGDVRYLDLAYPERLLAWEVDSRAFHSIGPDRSADAVRQEALERAGWRIERIRTDDLRRDPRGFAETVRRLLSQRPPVR